MGKWGGSTAQDFAHLARGFAGALAQAIALFLLLGFIVLPCGPNRSYSSATNRSATLSRRSSPRPWTCATAAWIRCPAQ